MKVSIAITAYNTEKYIQKAIESILNQTYKDFELILLDDGSTDHTGKIMDKYKDNKNVRVYHQENKGIPYSKSKCVELCRGEYIIIFDSDDIAEPTLIEDELAVFENSGKEIGVVYSNARLINEKDDVIKESYVTPFTIMSPEPLKDIVFLQAYPMSCMMFKADVFKKVGYYNQEYRVISDYDLMIRISRYYKYHYVDKKLSRYRIHNNNISGVGNISMMLNISKILERNRDIFLLNGIPNEYINKSIEIAKEGYVQAVNAEDRELQKEIHSKTIARLFMHSKFYRLEREPSWADKIINIFGFGMAGQMALEAADFFGYKIKNIFDNNQNKADQIYQGISIKHASYLKDNKIESKIFITSQYSYEIASQLKEYGYSENEDFMAML
ncbi:MAG: glycosyltransferase [Tissierellia bacterium]|nr:glycosyltransferase [Tissierellia bacterium]